MREIRLRHHHLLCAQTFCGKGYDHRFVAKMERVVAALESPEGVTVRLVTGQDDICAECPHGSDGLCGEGPSVMEKDRSVAKFLDLPEGAALPSAPLVRMVRERLLGLEDLGLICGGCGWIDLCNERLASFKNE